MARAAVDYEHGSAIITGKDGQYWILRAGNETPKNVSKQEAETRQNTYSISYVVEDPGPYPFKSLHTRIRVIMNFQNAIHLLMATVMRRQGQGPATYWKASDELDVLITAYPDFADALLNLSFVLPNNLYLEKIDQYPLQIQTLLTNIQKKQH